MRTVASTILMVGVIVFVRGTVQADLIAFVAHELRLVRNQGRVWQHSEGWLARMISRGEVVEGQFALPRKLDAGKYRFFVKARNGGAAVRISCGGDSAEATVDDADWNGLWSDPIPLNVPKATETLTMTFTNTSQTEAVNFILQGLYVTDRADVSVDGDDCILRLTASSREDDSPPIKGNLIPNGSFEAGLGQGWLLATPNERRDYGSATLRDDTAGYHGRACLRVPPWSSWTSRVIRVRPGRKHSLSLWAKAGSPDGRLVLELNNVHASPDKLRPATRLKKSFPVSDRQWERLSLADCLGGFPAPEYQVRISAQDAPIRIDAVQLEEGDATEFAPRKPLELGLVCEKPANVFFEDEKVAMRLLAFHGGDKPLSAEVRYEVYDYLNRKVKQGSIAVDARPEGAWQGEIDLSPGRRGAFRGVFWAEGIDGTDEETVYSVVPRPQRKGPDPDSMIGVHAVASDFQYDVLERLGVKWTRILSPEAWFRWHAVEPERGKFHWYDAEAEKTVRHGFQILGTIGTNTWPNWAYRDGKPDLDAWEQSVFEIVRHYRRWVKYWEVWNEPIHQFDAAFYARMLDRAARAIRRADPQAKIVGMGGSYDCRWCLDVIHRLDATPGRYMDYLSTHLYPSKADPLNPLSGTAAKEFRRQILVPYRMELWNTEAGAWCLGFYQGANSGFRSAGEPVWPHREAWRYYRGFDYEAARVARNFLHSIGNGFTRYFYYDSRFHAASYATGRTHCTIFDPGDTIRAKGVAYAILARLFDHCRGLGDVSPDPSTFAYLFDRGGTPLAAVFAADLGDVTHRRTIALGLAPEQFRAYDLMGNEIRRHGATIPFGRQPVYLKGDNGLSVDALKSAIQRAAIREVPDQTAPRITISEAPRGTIHPTPVRIRWIAVDETAIPLDDVHKDAIQYSYRLSGREADWSAWSTKTRVDLERLAPGTCRFEVKARDASGNVSDAAVHEFTVETESASEHSGSS